MPNTQKKFLDYPGLQVLVEEVKDYVTSQMGLTVQADWTETDTTSGSYIQHKPNIQYEVFSSTTPSSQNTGDVWTELLI